MGRNGETMDARVSRVQAGVVPCLRAPSGRLSRPGHGIHGESSTTDPVSRDHCHSRGAGEAFCSAWCGVAGVAVADGNSRKTKPNEPGGRGRVK